MSSPWPKITSIPREKSTGTRALPVEASGPPSEKPRAWAATPAWVSGLCRKIGPKPRAAYFAERGPFAAARLAWRFLYSRNMKKHRTSQTRMPTPLMMA